MAGRFAIALGFAALLGAGCDRPDIKAPFEPGQPLDIVASLSTNTVSVGDMVQLDVHIYHPPGATLQELPVRRRGREIDVSNRGYDTRPFSESHELTEVGYEISSWQLGEHVVATGTVTAVTSSGEVLTQAFPELVLDVRTVLSAPDEALQPHRGLRIPDKPSAWWLIIVFGLIALLAIGLALLFAFVLNKPKKAQVIARPRSPHLIALDALELLKAKNWIETREYEAFYVELSAIARTYLEDRFKLHAPEQTTEEFIRDAMRSGRLSEEHRALTGEFLEQCDLVKFARHEPEVQHMEDAFQSARRLVEETIPSRQPDAMQPANAETAA